MGVLLRYARVMLPRPNVRAGGEEEVDADVTLLVKSCEPLLQSRNPAVSIFLKSHVRLGLIKILRLL